MHICMTFAERISIQHACVHAIFISRCHACLRLHDHGLCTQISTLVEILCENYTKSYIYKIIKIKYIIFNECINEINIVIYMKIISYKPEGHFTHLNIQN